MALTDTTTVRLSGNPDSLGWSQVHEYVPPNIDSDTGKITVVISVFPQNETTSKTEPITRIQVLRDILSLVYTEYYKGGGGTYHSMVNALTKAYTEYLNSGYGLELGAITTVGETAYVAGVGGVRACLLRNGEMATLIPPSNSVLAGSGRVQAGDIFLLGTSDFFKEFGIGAVKGALANGLAVFSEQVSPRLRNLPSSGRLAVSVFEVLGGDTPKAEVPLPTPKRKKALPRVSFSFLRLGLVKIIDFLLVLLPERRMVVHPDTINVEAKSRKKMLPMLGALLLLLLVVSIVFGIKARANRTAKARYEERLTQAQHQFEEARSLAGLDMGRSKELILAAKEATDALKQEGVDDPALLDLSSLIEENLGALAGIYQNEATNYLDLSLVSSGFSGSSLAYSDGRALVLDSNGRKLVGIEVSNKRTEVITGPDYIPDASEVAAYTDRNFILSNDGVREVKEEGANLVVKNTWGEGGVLFGVFAANIYVLSSNDNMIWRYAGTASGFTEGSEWLAESTNVNLESAKAWAIDGTVWILLEDSLMQLTQGVIAKRSVNSSVSFTGALDIYTDEQTEYLYVLMPESVIVLTKEGSYLGEYKTDTIREADEFIVSEKDKLMLLLSGQKLYSIELSHLE